MGISSRKPATLLAIVAIVACSSDPSESNDGTGGTAGTTSTGGTSTGGTNTGGTSTGGTSTGGTTNTGGTSGSTSNGGTSGSGSGQVLFADDFESGNLDTWDSEDGEPDKYRITNDPTLVHAGSGALDITIRSDWSSGQLNKWFSAVEELHISMHAMFAANWDQNGVSSRHLLQLSGNHTEVMQWGPYPDSSFGQAGVTPDGTDFFWIHLTPWNDDAWHVGMAHPDQSSQWGDSLQSPLSTTPGTYQHVILHAKLNDLGASNGFVRLTIDGAIAIERTGVRWRTIDQLVFNSAGFQAYYQNFPATSHVYIDDFVVREGPP